MCYCFAEEECTGMEHGGVGIKQIVDSACQPETYKQKLYMLMG